MTVLNITKENFEETIEKNDLVLFDFWASWCGPCRFFGPIFEAAAEKNPDLVFAKIDTEAQPELAGGLGISSIPTLMVFKEQIGVFGQPGALPAAQLDELIKQVRDLNMDEVRAELAKKEAAKKTA